MRERRCDGGELSDRRTYLRVVLAGGGCGLVWN